MALYDIKWYKSFAAAGIFGFGMWGLRAVVPENSKIAECKTAKIIGIESIDDKMEADLAAMEAGTISKASDETTYTFNDPANGKQISFTLKQRRDCDKAVEQHRSDYLFNTTLSNLLITPTGVMTYCGLLNLFTGGIPNAKSTAATLDPPALC